MPRKRRWRAAVKLDDTQPTDRAIQASNRPLLANSLRKIVTQDVLRVVFALAIILVLLGGALALEQFSNLPDRIAQSLYEFLGF
ncbi:hypothetical protein HYW32_01830 [Candidatus Berkelbacteria bacterium]|nr:hypothetical protein [Candidatus Berkelbacteria bacterium]